MRRRTGFTFLEALVAGTIAVIIGMTAMTLFRMNSRQSRDGTLHALLDIQYDVVSDQIGKAIRRSNVVLETGQNWPPTPGLPAAGGVSAIFLKSTAGQDSGGFRTNAGKLEERVLSGGAWVWRVFTVGQDSVRVTGTSGFSLSSDRKTVVVGLSTIRSYQGLTDTVNSRGETWFCRN